MLIRILERWPHSRRAVLTSWNKRLVGLPPSWRPPAASPMPHAPAALHQAVTIQHRVDGAFGQSLDPSESPHQALADLAHTPTGMLVLDVEDGVFHLKGELMAYR